MRQLSYFISFVLCLLVANAEAVIYTEDFEYSQPSGSAWTSADGIFTHTMSDDAIWEINGETNQRMILTRGTYTITFNLLPEQSVDVIGFDYTINDLWQTTFNVYTPGFMNTIGIDSGSPYYPTFDSDLWCLSTSVYRAYAISLFSSAEADLGLSFDNISINVVPEPTSIILLGFGAVVIRRRK